MPGAWITSDADDRDRDPVVAAPEVGPIPPGRSSGGGDRRSGSATGREDDPRPDGYFEIRRQVGGEVTATSFVLALQRSLKSSTVLASKLERYADFHCSRHCFGTRDPRVPMVLTTDLWRSGVEGTRQAVEQAKRLGVALPRFSSQDALVAITPLSILTAPLWWKIGGKTPLPLLPS
jgi:hypothetical protein